MGMAECKIYHKTKAVHYVSLRQETKHYQKLKSWLACFLVCLTPRVQSTDLALSPNPTQVRSSCASSESINFWM